MGIKFGCIRWTAWYPEPNPTGGNNFPVNHVAYSLAPKKWQSCAPFWTQVKSPNRIAFAPSIATMEQEIAAAAAANIHHWAFLRYATTGNDSTINNGLTLYQQASNKGLVKWCRMTDPRYCGTTGNFTAEVNALVVEFQQSNYALVLTNRPLLYVTNSDGGIGTNWGGNRANFAAMITALRNATIAAGLGTPYIVVVRLEGNNERTFQTDIGGDAVTTYTATNAYTITSRRNLPYSDLSSKAAGYWADRATTNNVVPIVMAGFDDRPRFERPQRWYAGARRPHFATQLHWAQPTTSEFTAHVQAARTFIEANPTACPSEVALCYAWDEFDEGGWLCPTIGDPTGSKLSAIASILA